MEKKVSENREQSKLRAFLTGDRLKALLPLIGFAVILLVMHILTDGKILTPKKMRLLLSQIYYPTIVATGVFFIMTLGSIDSGDPRRNPDRRSHRRDQRILPREIQTAELYRHDLHDVSFPRCLRLFHDRDRRAGQQHH